MADRNQPCCSRGELNDFVYLQIIPAVKLLSGGVVPALLTVAAGGDPCDALKCAIKRGLGLIADSFRGLRQAYAAGDVLAGQGHAELC